MGRIEENEQILESVQKSLDNICKARDEYIVDIDMKINLSMLADVIGLLSDISRSLAVIAEGGLRNENSKRNTKEDA